MEYLPYQLVQGFFHQQYQLGRHRTNEPMSCCFVNAQDVTDQICSQLVGYPQIRLDVLDLVIFWG